MSFFSKLFGKKGEQASNTPTGGENTTQVSKDETKIKPYGGVPLLEAPKVDGPTEIAVDMRAHNISGVFTVSLPADWEPFESDRFRAKSQDGTTQLSITASKREGNPESTSDLFTKVQQGMYERFVSEGGYEPYDDLLITDGFITQSFKVDDETQYYMTSTKMVNGQTIIMNIIIRNIGDYDLRLRTIIQVINSSVAFL